jgi:type I restriction enzyme S subunit
MNLTKLAEHAFVTIGQGAPQDANAFSREGNPFIRAGSLDGLTSGGSFDTLEFLTDDAAKKYKMKLYPANSVVFAKSGMSATKNRVYKLPRPCYVVSHLAVLLPNEKTIPEYLRLVLQRAKPSTLIKDFSYPSIGQSDIENFKLPFPPPDDQIRIAAVLNRAEKLIAKRKESIKALDELLKSTFLEMFGDPVRNDKEWKRVPFSELLTKIESGHSPVCLDRPTNSGEWGVLKLGAVTQCIYKPNENKALPESEMPNPEIEIRNGDILFSRKNTYDLVAACAYVWKTPPRLLMSDLIFRFVPNDKKTINPIYLQALLSFSTKRKMIQKLAGGAAGSMPNISKSKLLEHKIEVPPIAIQTQFVAIVTKVESLKNRYTQSLTELENLYSSLSQRAFKGELDLSRVPLSSEIPVVSGAEKIEAEDKQPIAPLIVFPAPADLSTLQSAEDRKALIRQWLTIWMEHLGDASFSTQPFMSAVRQRLRELSENEAMKYEEGKHESFKPGVFESVDSSVSDYDELKAWIFEALAQSRLTQSYDDANNRVRITKAKG